MGDQREKVSLCLAAVEQPLAVQIQALPLKTDLVLTVIIKIFIGNSKGMVPLQFHPVLGGVAFLLDLTTVRIPPLIITLARQHPTGRTEEQVTILRVTLQQRSPPRKMPSPKL